jgi:hypothetical protein
MPSKNSAAASLQRRSPNFRLVGLEPPAFVAVNVEAASETQGHSLSAPSKHTQSIQRTSKLQSSNLLASRVPLPRPAVPREKITGPLSAVPDPTDETLFEDAAKPETKYYLPRYRVAEQMVSGKPQFRIKLDQQAQGGTLTVFLERFPAPTLEAIARQAVEIPHSIAVKLVARIPIGTSQIQQEFEFQEITKEGELLKAVLRMEQLAQLTQVYQVLTEASFAAALIVLRSVSAAVPVPASNSAEIQQLSSEIQKLRQEISELTKQITAIEARMRQLEKLGPANTGARRMLAVLRRQINNLNVQRTAKMAEMRKKRAQLASLRRQKLFEVVSRVMDWTVAPNPFVFTTDLHRYIFGNVVPPEGGKIGFVLRQVVWRERSHTYYQESLEPHRFHFLPDSFKVARRPETPHYPTLAVRFPNPDAAVDVMPVTLEYVAEPYFDSERLEAAAAEMKRKLPELAGGDREIEFEPLLSDTTRLFLTLPRGETGPQREERKGATISLRTGILDAITLPMRDFQGLFDALLGSSAVVFQGEVVLEIDAGIPADRVPVICRLSDLIGDIFDVNVEQDASASGVRATLHNAIESPAEIRGLEAVLTRGDMEADGVISGLSFEAPVAVRPGEALNCQVTPTTVLGGSGEVAVLFDFDQVVVKPDAEAVWAAVVDQTKLPEFTRTIKVKTIKQTFEPKPDQPSDPVVAVVVDFERGDTVELNADKLETDAKVRLSLADYVIRRLDTAQYRYAVTVIRASGQSRDSEWRTDRIGILFPQIN